MPPSRTFTPPAVVTAVADQTHAPPAVAAVGAVGTLIGSAWWQLAVDRRQLLRESPVGYLLSVKRALKPRTVVERKAELLTRARLLRVELRRSESVTLRVWLTIVPSRFRRGLLAEDLVHDLGAAGQGRNDLVPVDQFRRGCLVVAGQQRDRLHRNTAS